MVKNSIRKEYAHIKQKEKRIIQAALDASGDGRCWWVYKHILASLKVGERNNRGRNEWNARVRAKETSTV